jgi:hypothetical protein
LYSSRKSWTANSHELTFRSPDLKNAAPTPIRIASWMIDKGKRSSFA